MDLESTADLDGDPSASHVSPDQLVDLAEQVTRAGSLADAATVVVKHAADWSAARWAEVVEAPEERFRIVAATDVELSRALYRTRQLSGQNPPLPGPRPPSDRIVIDDLGSDGRWASLTAAAPDLPLRSAVLHFLVVEGRWTAGMAVYHDRPGWFTPNRLGRLDLLARLAAPLLAGQADAERNAQLAVALQSSRTIGTAVGMLMRDRHTGQAEAFATLVRLSQQTNRKLRDVAAALVDRG